MASITIVLYANHTKKNGLHPIYLRVGKNKNRKLFYTGRDYDPNLWDSNKGEPKKKSPNYRELMLVLSAYKDKAMEVDLALEKENPNYTLEDFENNFLQKDAVTQTLSVLDFTQEIKENFLKTHEIRTADTYKQLAAKLVKFCEREGISVKFSFVDITMSFLTKLEQMMREEKMAETSMSVYFRTLRAVFNKGIVEGYAKKELYPFNEYKISKFNTKTRKRAITKDDMQKMIALDLPEGTNLYDARNIFLFSYYTMGTNYIDMAYLEWKDIINEKLVYTRSKTGDLFNLKLVEPARKILEYYKAYRSDNYIFPILDIKKHSKDPVKATIRLNTANKIINKKLKEIGKTIGADIEITTYVARHTSATNLKRSNIPVSVISQAMGHESEKVTQIYLDSIENDAVDNALDFLL